MTSIFMFVLFRCQEPAWTLAPEKSPGRRQRILLPAAEAVRSTVRSCIIQHHASHEHVVPKCFYIKDLIFWKFCFRSYGPIRWNSQHTGLPPQQSQHQPPPPPHFGVPPPPSGSYMRPPMFRAPSANSLPNPFVHPSQQQMGAPPPHMNYHWSQVLNRPPPPPPRP